MSDADKFDAVCDAIDATTVDLPRPLAVAAVNGHVDGTPTIHYGSYDDLLAWIDRGDIYPCGDLAHHVDGGLVGNAVYGRLPGGWFVTVTAPLPGGE